MKKELKKVSKKETFEEQYARETKENREKLFRFLKANSGTTLNDLLDNYIGLTEYDFFRDMIFLLDEKGIVSDCGCSFPDEETRQEMAEEGLY
jgi:hypothetical protein